jgi:S-adenosylmethionine synthetase
VIKMTRNIQITKLSKPLWRGKLEKVERKGVGHPDFMADSIAEEFSRNLSKEYIKKFGCILHHNVDKLEIVGGGTAPAFGGGKFITPIKIIFSGRATYDLNGDGIDVPGIAISSAKSWIKNNLRYLDPDDATNVVYQVETKKGSGNLTDLYARKAGGPLPANDTSFGVGFAPYTETENVALKLEQFFNSKEFKTKYPASGEDIKVMASKHGKKLDVTVCMAMVGRHIRDVKEYVALKEAVKKEACEFVQPLTGLKVKLSLNTADNPERGVDGCYLTVSGTSAEHGDDGAVGRGNRPSGLITPYRPMSLEAAAGKNPVNHVGKIYNALACQIAQKVHEQFKVEDVVVQLLSRIGIPIDQPQMAGIQIRGNGYDKNAIKAFVDEELANVTKLQIGILEGKYTLF